MTSRTSNWGRSLVPFAALVVLTGCTGSSSGAKADTSAAGTPAASGSAASTPAATDGSVAPDAAASSEGVGPGDFILPDPLVGLSDLSSYQATLTVSFDGSDGGKSLQWTSTTVMLRSQQPAAAAVTIENSGDLAAAVPGFVAESDGTAFRRDGTGACTAEPAEPDASLVAVFEPAAELAGVMGGEAAGQKAIDGIDALGYSFDERAVGQAGVGHTTGEVWVAADTGYVLSYAMSSKGGSELFGDGVEGTISWEYELTDVNQPVVVELPEECQASFVDAPTTPDATNIINASGLLSFDTAMTPTDVQAFYDQAAPGLGWTSAGSAPTANGLTAEYSTGDHVVTLDVEMADSGSHVNLVIGDAPSSGSGGGTAGGGGGGGGAAAQGQATFEMSGGHSATGTWDFVPQFSFFGAGAWTMSFTDPANPMPEGSFLTLVLAPGEEKLSFSDGRATITDATDACTFAIDHQDASGASGSVNCVGAAGIGASGGIDISITFSVTP